MKKFSVRWKVILIGLLVLVVTGSFTVWYSVNAFQKEITRLNRQDYGERIRNIEYDYKAVDAVSMASAEVYTAQEALLTHLEERYVNEQDLSAYPFIMNGDHEAILYLPQSGIGRDFFTSQTVSRLEEIQNGSFEFSYDGTRYWALFSYFEPWDWYTGYMISDAVRFAGLSAFARNLAASIGVAVLLLAVGYLVSLSRMLGPLNQVPTAMERVIQGDLSRPLAVKSRDEVGRIAHSFNLFVDSLKSILGQIQQTSRENMSSEEELNQKAGGTLDMLESINNNTSTIKSTILQLNENIERATETMQRVTTGVTSLDSSIDDQLSAVTQSTASIEEMSASLTNVAHITRSKRESSELLLQTVQEGGEKLANTQETIRDITNSVDDIGDLVDMIKGIASQTNLLSMNAAIEAAHAGDAGRGFAVVADEIRKLASDAGENSAHIAELVNQIIAKIRLASSASDETGQAFESIDREVHAVAESFQEISDSTDELSAGSAEIQRAMVMLNEISNTVKQGSQDSLTAAHEIVAAMRGVIELSSEVLHAISGISDQSARSADAMQDITGVAARLRENVGELNRVVARFRTNGDVSSVADSPTEVTLYRASEEAADPDQA